MTDRNLYRYLFLSLLTGLLMFSTTGCSDSIPVQEAGDVTSRASLAVDVQGVSTTVPTDGNYDTYIETLRVIGFDASGNVLCNKRYANNSVGGNGLTVTDGQFQLTQPLDGAFQGGTCRFYFVANEEYYTLYQTNRRLSDYLANPVLAEADLKNCVIAYAPTPDRISGSYPILMTAVSDPQFIRPGMNRMEAVSLMRSLVKVQLQVLKGAAVTDGVTVSEVKLQGTYPDSYSLWNTRDYTGYTSQPMDVDLFSTDPNRPFIGPVMYLPEKMMRGQSTDQDLKFTFLLASGALTSRYELGIGAGNGDGITDYALYRNNRYQTTATFNGWKKLMNLSFTVADWIQENVALDYTYPTTTCTPVKMRVNENGEEVPDFDTQVYIVNTADLFARLSAAFGLRFLMTEPVGQLWTATLQGGYYELMVFDYLGNDITADKSKWISGKEPFTVYVIPTQPYDKNPGEGMLRIATRTWGGENDMLLINRDNRFNADDHPLQTEIRIRQIEAPVSE